jgi:hypothetical protein
LPKEIAKNEKNKPENKDLDLGENGFRIVINDGINGCKAFFNDPPSSSSPLTQRDPQVRVCIIFTFISLAVSNWAGHQVLMRHGKIHQIVRCE